MSDNVNQWVTIFGFDKYEICRNGKIRNKNSGKLKTPSISKRGYYVVSLYDNNGKFYLKTLHRLLALAFIPNPLKLPQINHIDGDKLNCNLSNLEWCDSRYNLLHARKTGLHKSDGDKRVYQYDLDGNFVNSYKSASEASRQLKLNRGNICSVCRGTTRLKTVGGYIWKYE